MQAIAIDITEKDIAGPGGVKDQQAREQPKNVIMPEEKKDVKPAVVDSKASKLFGKI